jgi:hypothetical protein
LNLPSSFNPWRLLVMRHPQLTTTDRAAFDQLLERTPAGSEVDYDLPQPKWWFLHHLVTHGFVLHGSNEPAIGEFRTRQTFNAHDVPIDAVFAADDAIWPIYFAVVNRPVAKSYINWCEHPGNGTSRYLFSIGSDPGDDASWVTGTIYVLPRETFEPTPGGSRELVSLVPVRPRARLTLEPEDFPYKRKTRGHRRGDSVRKVSLKHALRLR